MMNITQITALIGKLAVIATMLASQASTTMATSTPVIAPASCPVVDQDAKFEQCLIGEQQLRSSLFATGRNAAYGPADTANIVSQIEGYLAACMRS